MAQTLSQKLTFQWIAVAGLAAGVLLCRMMGWMTPSYVLVLIAIGIFVFGIVPTWARSLSGAETASEAAARQTQGSRAAEKLALRQESLAQSDMSADPLAQTSLMYDYAIAWDKTANPIPNGLVAGWRASPVDIYDGDFTLLAKQREMMHCLVSSHRKPDKWVAKLGKLDKSILGWRKGAQEIRDGIREAPDHFNAVDYLRRLDEAFPRSEPQPSGHAANAISLGEG